MRVFHRHVTVEGKRLFYREAGEPDTPAVVLLHGYPTSSFMFRDLIPRLADRYHVIAPDHLGFGQSDSPTVDEFDYSFDSLARLTAGLLGQLGLKRYAIYVQDYGAPIGWRLALQPGAPVTAVITQNGNGYEAGFVPDFWEPVWAYGENPNAQTEAAMRTALDRDAIVWQYTHGVPDPSVVSPDTWTLDHALLQRPGNAEVQLGLFRDYSTNRALYPRLQEHLRASRVPVLAVWGRNDQIFSPEGAKAFGEDLPDAEVHLLDGGHFLLESDLEGVTELTRDFLGRFLGTT
ncbi:alpha/beta fold hydrolase [Plantactinospora soyae]|uniref:Pimeloyl-ACP methyl ester carboxylesterase n=1 Tax=Plantactinospora soyae TaxID=1544732 RepID=A0A927M766_9ACTN|nr:alpha/beta hydrolase [Plantactinospora soyae]MBE1489249.1 pimeloyl-ACP methyl ester carboxylesterase [Plantactinospora soyae]